MMTSLGSCVAPDKTPGLMPVASSEEAPDMPGPGIWHPLSCNQVLVLLTGESLIWTNHSSRIVLDPVPDKTCLGTWHGPQMQDWLCLGLLYLAILQAGLCRGSYIDTAGFAQYGIAGFGLESSRYSCKSALQDQEAAKTNTRSHANLLLQHS